MLYSRTSKSCLGRCPGQRTATDSAIRHLPLGALCLVQKAGGLTREQRGGRGELNFLEGRLSIYVLKKKKHGKGIPFPSAVIIRVQRLQSAVSLR